MRAATVAWWVSVFGLSLGLAQAQPTNEVDKLEQRLKQLQESFDKQQRELRDSFERQLREQQAQIEELKRRLAAAETNAAPAGLAHGATAPAGVRPSPGAATSVSQAAPEPSNALVDSQLAAPGDGRTPDTNASASAAAPWSPASPIRIGSTQNYLNLSFDGLFAVGTSTASDIEQLELGGHDPNQRGFTVQNLETVFEGKVDPYFRGQANIVLQIDPQGETTIEAEEAYMETMALPWNLQAKAGQFFTEFGRLNPQHPHTWDFVDQPLVNGRFLGPDGLRSAGARLSWLAPTPFYSELFLAIQNSQGETAFSFRNEHEGELFFGRPAAAGRVKSFGDMLFAPRYAASFNLSDAQTLVAGASAALGPNSSDEHSTTQIYGLDLFWKWKSPRQHAGFPFVTWQTELMLRRFEAGAFPGNAVLPALPAETLYDYGLYSQVAYGFRKGWVAALRGDYLFPGETGFYETVLGPDPGRATRWRISPNLTYYPSEFSKLRLQYNFDRRDLVGDDHSVWMQFEFLLGSHAAHKF